MNERLALHDAAALDRADPLADRRSFFELPEGVIYLDGNSLGPLTRTARERVAKVVADEWGRSLIRGWNEHDWIDLPSRVGDRIGRLVGAAPGSLVVCDSTSVNVFKALAAALRLRPDRRVILSDTGNFPTDLYMAEGLANLLGRGHDLKTVEPEAVESEIDETVAVVMLTEVDYRTGRRHNMKMLTDKAHAAGALAMWDLAHSAGAFPVDLGGADADFAVGCGYKYLNGGPGAPAFVYVAPRLAGEVVQPLSGWMGHAQPFAFDLGYAPAAGVDRMRVGTPPVLSVSALDAALDVFDGVDMADVRRKSLALCERFVAEVEACCPELVLASPRSGDARGSQVSFRHPDGYAIMRALIDRGVIGDFRAPDIIRFGFAPLYLRHADVVEAAGVLGEIMRDRLFERPEYRTRSKVT